MLTFVGFVTELATNKFRAPLSPRPSEDVKGLKSKKL